MAERKPRDKHEDSLRERLEQVAPIVLDGATGTELERRGHPSSLPLWSSHALVTAPDAIEDIHRAYVQAGAEVLTANTFRTQSRVLSRVPEFEGRARELTELAVTLARSAAADSTDPVWVAGSAPPLEDCYRPDQVPDRDALDREHREHAANLARAGVDLILIETMNCIAEARAAAGAAADTGLPAWLSFVCDGDARLLSGEDLATAIEAVRPFGTQVVLVNCLAPTKVEVNLEILKASAMTFGVYANLGAPYENSPDQRVEDHTPEEFAERARTWVDAGARVIGGCCGTQPPHIRALRRAFPR